MKMFYAGILVGIGCAVFFIFVPAREETRAIMVDDGLFRIGVGLVGGSLAIAGGVWQTRLRRGRAA